MNDTENDSKIYSKIRITIFFCERGFKMNTFMSGKYISKQAEEI